jgi:hypothetical protein
MPPVHLDEDGVDGEKPERGLTYLGPASPRVYPCRWLRHEQVGTSKIYGGKVDRTVSELDQDLSHGPPR